MATKIKTAEDLTVRARRGARFVHAKRRMVLLRDTEPKFTADQIEQLCAVLRGEAE